ncbi:hypothetical protein C5L30_000350 [Companilactobacillus farciminis]|uniref:Uncharacterized protein n=1 Tax=Companilactobacillus farciminis TaxID=1612 RepID=A0A4R5NK77_9LACO|nr:hypothetical protein [Companilactobacillus farciminis]TDG74634.1 hypothetical protein C5L30_000350 [Companilactobacillus farciminis]
MMAKMIRTSCGLMTPMEAKMIGDVDRELKRNPINKIHSKPNLMASKYTKKSK